MLVVTGGALKAKSLTILDFLFSCVTMDTFRAHFCMPFFNQNFNGESSMATKRPTRRRQPFVVEPLNWVAPDVARDESEKSPDDAKQPAPAKEQQD